MKHALQTGASAFVGLAVAALIHDCDRVLASDVPPVIGEVRGVLRDVRRALDRPAQLPRHTTPVDGPMCEVPLELDHDDDIAERLLVERYLAECSRTGPRSDPWLVLRVVRVEAALGIPSGLLAAVVCWETGYTHDARGDWQDGHARAHGHAQMHGWWMGWCGLSEGARDDVDAALRCYWRRVEHYLADGVCAGNLARAEAMAANGPRYLPWSCRARSEHWLEWARWR